MNITADAVKELRERTGAGMMECKKALVETNGDLDAAAEIMRKSGSPRPTRRPRASPPKAWSSIEKSADGKTGVLVEVNCETDFVARGDDFRGFAADVAKAALAAGAGERRGGQLASKLASGETVDEKRRALIAKIGENIDVRRVDARDGADRRGLLRARRQQESARWSRSRAATPTSARDLAMQSSRPARATSRRRDVPAEHGGEGARNRIEQAKATRNAKASRPRSSPRWSKAVCASPSTRSR